MSHRKYLLVIVAATLLAGCVSPQYNYTPSMGVLATAASLEPRLAKPGETLVSYAKRKEQDALYVRNPVKIGFAYTIGKGYYNKEGDNGKADFYFPAGGEEAGVVDKGLLSDPWKTVMVPRTNDRICIVTIFRAKACWNTTDFEQRKRPIPTEDALEKSLVFRGAEGDRVLLGYRESRNGIVNPAASRDFSLDRAAAPQFSYGGARIEILGATAEHLTYKVLAPFSP